MYKSKHFCQDGNVIDNVLSTGNSSFLTLQGMTGENGSYACRLSNSLHESYKYFAVNFAEESPMQTIIISVVVVLAVVLIGTIGMSIKFYHDKVYV